MGTFTMEYDVKTDINIPAKKFSAAQGTNLAPAAIPPGKGVEDDSVPTLREVLKPVCPDPDTGFQQLSTFLVKRVTKCVMGWMKKLCREWRIALDMQYWESKTHTILGQPSPNKVLIIPAPAGSGKSTWILAFHLALKELFGADPALADALVGTTVVLQKVEDLNTLADTLNQGCPPDQPFMAALQGWNSSGKKRGFCLNTGVDSYDECTRNSCPFSLRCPILQFREQAPYAPVVGLTQERFYLLRQGDLSSILYRIGQDGCPRPRRFILFDEKFQMAPVIVLDMEKINQASSEFTDLIRKLSATDARVSGLQQGLSYAVWRPFQKIRKQLRTPTEQGALDIPVGILTLNEEGRECAEDYFLFRKSLSRQKRYHPSKTLSDVLLVMDKFYDGQPCLFGKTNGFQIFRIDLPQIRFGASQTIIFDATAEVDGDYCNLDHVQFLAGTPKSAERKVVFHIHTHPDLNVSKTALKKSWKVPAFSALVAELVQSMEGSVFLCTYKDFAVALADSLRKRLDPEDFSRLLLMPDREVPTLPYFNGTNGSNAFRNATNVIIIGYPRLDPQTYLSFSCAAFGQDCIATELEAIPENHLLSPGFSLLELPSVQNYVDRHLAARLEQEIYRCRQRDPNFDGEIHIHLFYPPKGALSILLRRIPGSRVEDKSLPLCVEQAKGVTRQYDGGPTSYTRLLRFLATWDGTRISVRDLRDGLQISPAVWKDLMEDRRVKALLEKYGIQRIGRGVNAMWAKPQVDCA